MTIDIAFQIITAIIAAAGGSLLTYRAVNRKTDAETQTTLDHLNDSVLARVRDLMALERAHFEREIVDLQADIDVREKRINEMLKRVEDLEKLRVKDRSRMDHLESGMRVALEYIGQLRDLLVTNRITPPPLHTNLIDWQRWTE